MSEETKNNKTPEVAAPAEKEDALKEVLDHMDEREMFKVLYNTVLERQLHPEEGSYTSYLFNKGEGKILKKVGEECTEVIIASLSQSKEELVGEISDLLYHLMVLMAAKGVTLEDVEQELARRHKKEHNLKAERRPITQY